MPTGALFSHSFYANLSQSAYQETVDRGTKRSEDKNGYHTAAQEGMRLCSHENTAEMLLIASHLLEGDWPYFLFERYATTPFDE